MAKNVSTPSSSSLQELLDNPPEIKQSEVIELWNRGHALWQAGRDFEELEIQIGEMLSAGCAVEAGFLKVRRRGRRVEISQGEVKL
jgi:hypothetical protein